MIERDEMAAWLRLLEAPRVGRTAARRLLAAFGSPASVLDALPASRAEIVGHEQAHSVGKASDSIDALIDETWAWLNEAGDVPRAVVTLGDACYPASLLETADPPLLLYAQGALSLLSAPSIAVVGSRNPTPQGLENAQAFSQHLSLGGITVVSGLALGIDGAAHEGGLAGAGSTIAVCGTGLDRVYPSRHRALAHRITRAGLMLSEHPLGTPPLRENFPGRNRIIAGLSRGTLVVEAALQSGSLITARMALESGREVFSIPGSIHSTQSRGCHWLIKQGAKLVETANDIFEELQMTIQRETQPESEREESLPPTVDAPLLKALGYDPMSLDALVERTGRSASDLNAKLLELELEGYVARLPGQLFQRRSRA
ncbi:MAG: dprA [Rhizobacter sp.]|nr:dprA [Rhizobacter sp.]